MSAPIDVHAAQTRYFELLRKRRFHDLYYVPDEREAATLYVRSERASNGEVKHYPSRAVLCCPNPADNAEIVALENAIEQAGVRMYL